MEFFKTLTLTEIKECLSVLPRHASDTEIIPVDEALNRVTSKACSATYAIPMFNRSTVDGYAVKSGETTGATETLPSFFTIIGEVHMGELAKMAIGEGEAVYVPTGGMIPDGADAMVMIEYAEKIDDETLLIYKPSAPGAHISYCGDDVEKGESIVPKSKKITPYDMGLLAGAGYQTVPVFKRLKVAIISTGDEIIDVSEPIAVGKIRDVNGYALMGRLGELGCDVVMKVLVKDQFDQLYDTVKRALDQADLVLLSGGSSVGTRDFTSKVITSFENSELLTHGVAVKPGKPTIVGKVGDKHIIGLPGHPASALIIFNTIVMPLILAYEGRIYEPFTVKAMLTENIHAAAGKDTFQMVQLVMSSEGWTCTPIYAKSGMMTLLSKASGYIHMTNEEEGKTAGTLVDVALLQEVQV